MECIYIENIDERAVKIDVPPDEAKHLKTLRINTANEILITNGKGICAVAEVERISKIDYRVEIKHILANYGELDNKISLAIGILDNGDRMEFCLEKCIELGVSEFFFLQTDFSQRTKINSERLYSKSIAAIKQCKRARLPIIHPPISLDKLIGEIADNSNNNHSDSNSNSNSNNCKNKYSQIILADENGISPIKTFQTGEANNSIVFVGAEGGFSEREIKLFPNTITKWNLGNRRLRAETAAITAIGILSIQ
jgi:16S rRNA (uracil1498-N3)-methyltransferase